MTNYDFFTVVALFLERDLTPEECTFLDLCTEARKLGEESETPEKANAHIVEFAQ